MLLPIATDCRIDLGELLQSRLLVIGASGSGKSFLLRRIIEQALPFSAVTLFDCEGEFTTLAALGVRIDQPEFTSFTSAVAWSTGTALSAFLSSRSNVINLSALALGDSQLIVDAYCRTLLDRQETERRIIVLDEAHLFAPQTAGTNKTRGIIADLASRGRKRGLCLIAATQRVSKLHKDVAAELRNVFVGQSNHDSDIRRSLEIVGLTSSAPNRLMVKALRHQFIGYGPAIQASETPIESFPPKTSAPQKLTPEIGPLAPPVIEQTTVLIHWQDGLFRKPRPLATLTACVNPLAAMAIAKSALDHGLTGRDFPTVYLDLIRAIDPAAKHSGGRPDVELWWPKGWVSVADGPVVELPESLKNEAFYQSPTQTEATQNGHN